MIDYLMYGVENTRVVKNSVKEVFGDELIVPDERIVFVNDPVELQRQVTKYLNAKLVMFTDDDETFGILKTIKWGDQNKIYLARASADALEEFTNLNYGIINAQSDITPFILNNKETVAKGYQACIDYTELSYADEVILKKKADIEQSNFGRADLLRAYTNYVKLRCVKNTDKIAERQLMLYPTIDLKTDASDNYFYAEAFQEIAVEDKNIQFILLNKMIAALADKSGFVLGYTDLYQCAKAGLEFKDGAIDKSAKWDILAGNAARSIKYYG